jgi:hypothetical protein
MAIDAKFEDSYSTPIRLEVFDDEDLQVVSALCQDSVLSGEDISWQSKKGRLTLLLNRFRWEEKSLKPERVRSLLIIHDVTKVASKAFSINDKNKVYSLISLKFEAIDEIGGKLSVIFSNDSMIAASIQCLNIKLQDVTRPYQAPSGNKPKHDE